MNKSSNLPDNCQSGQGLIYLFRVSRYNPSMILTIFGYPKTGKTLLFNLLTEKKEKISQYSTTGNEFHKAIVDVPDPRLQKLAAHFETPPVYAKIEFLDAGAISLGEDPPGREGTTPVSGETGDQGTRAQR